MSQHENIRSMLTSSDVARLPVRELLASGLDELLLMLVPVTDEAREREQLMQVIASL